MAAIFVKIKVSLPVKPKVRPIPMELGRPYFNVRTHRIWGRYLFNVRTPHHSKWWVLICE